MPCESAMGKRESAMGKRESESDLLDHRIRYGKWEYAMPNANTLWQWRRKLFFGRGAPLLSMVFFIAEGSEQRRETPICPREARKKNFTFIFQLSGWALVAPSCFALHCNCFSAFCVICDRRGGMIEWRGHDNARFAGRGRYTGSPRLIRASVSEPT